MDITLMTLLASQDDWDHHWWPIWPLLGLVVIVAVVWFFKRGRWNGPRSQTGADRARDILAERYARGEITGEEYRERLEGLRQLGLSPAGGQFVTMFTKTEATDPASEFVSRLTP